MTTATGKKDMKNTLLSRCIRFSITVTLGIGTGHAVVDISELPVYTLLGVEPNITLSLDDSGSMTWSYMPDGIALLYGPNRAKSSTFNRIYYDPAITYEVPVNENGNSLGNTSFLAAWNDGYDLDDRDTSCKVNLSTSYRPTWDFGDQCDGVDSWDGGSYPEYAGNAETAYYYVYDGSGDINVDSNYDKVIVATAEEQNFANWYSYYRKRSYVAKAAATLSFSRLSSGFRLNHQTINSGGNNSLNTLEKYENTNRTDFFNWLYDVPADGSTPLRAAMKVIGESYKSNSPYRDDPTDSSSPMRTCRQNFHVLMTDGYWNGDPGIGSNRDGSTGWGSYTINANEEGITGTYDPTAQYADIFEDSETDNLADTAFHYWITDLRPTLDNGVKPTITDRTTDFNGDGTTDALDHFWNPKNNPATWQHLVNYTVGLGVNGAHDFPGDYDGLRTGTENWGTDQIDDLWHSAINSRGEYFNARNPQQMVSAFRAILSDIVDRSGSGSAATIDSPVLNTTSLGYQASFNTGDWTGDLKAFKFSDGTGSGAACNSSLKGSICTTPEWSAASKLASQNWNTGRNIVTYNPTANQGVAFRWGSLISTQKTALKAGDNNTVGRRRLKYIRGHGGNEGTGSDFRVRTPHPDGGRDVLGDIVNSSPLFVGPPSLFLPENEFGGYAAFKTSKASRQPVVYAGANDGMLHAFNASNCTSPNCGKELFSYVPNAVYSNLADLTAKDYDHTNYVDGSLVSADVKIGGNWRTVLVGTMGLGGKGVFALNITDPSNFSEANAANMVLWEFTDPDLGVVQGKPIITKLNNGVWGVIFNNGYNSTNEDGYLYVVRLSDGVLLKKIAVDTSFSNNGLSSILDTDDDQNFTTDTVFAGDLNGNLWKFDLSSTVNASQWKVAYKQGSTPKPAYVALNSSSQRQAITTAPVIRSHPTGNGHIVYFGTGKYLGRNDIFDTSIQTMYAVWVKSGVEANSGDHQLNITRSHLLSQSIVADDTSTFTANDARITGNAKIKWHDNDPTLSQAVLPSDGDSDGKPDTHLGWYLDFNTEAGERVHQSPFLRADRLIFVTVTPSSDPCEEGGTSWLYELEALSGSRLSDTPFDYNVDGKFDKSDYVPFDLNGDGTVDADEKVPGSGIRVKDTGVYYLDKSSVMTLGDGDDEVKNVSTSASTIISVREKGASALPRSWTELLN